MKSSLRAISVLFLSAAMLAQGASWGAWQSYGSNGVVQISFARVNATTMTWKFRNGSANCTLKPFNFRYTYTDADTGQFTAQNDIMPENLGPGQVLGGWTAFSANTRGGVEVMTVDNSINFQCH